MSKLAHVTAVSRLALHLGLAAAAGYVGAALHQELRAGAASPQARALAHTRAGMFARDVASAQGTATAVGYRAAAARAAASIVTVYRASPRAGMATVTLGIGSGVILDREGTIVTTSELASQEGNLRVGLADGTQRPARVLGIEAASGLAFLKVDGPALEPIDTAGAEKAAVGDTVLALGDALGFGSTVTQGIISAIRTAQMGSGAPAEFIQTDAAIHAGNFGGALVDAAGRLVGINVGTLGGDGREGFALAVPADRVARAAAQFRRGRRAEPTRPQARYEPGRVAVVVQSAG